MIWLNMCLAWKLTKKRTTTSFFKISVCSATSIESSRRDLLNDMAEHVSSMKNKQDAHYSLIFQDRSVFSHNNEKFSLRPFEWYGYEHVYSLNNNQDTHYSLIFQDRSVFSHINRMLSSRRFKWFCWTCILLEQWPRYALLSYFSR